MTKFHRREAEVVGLGSIGGGGGVYLDNQLQFKEHINKVKIKLSSFSCYVSIRKIFDDQLSLSYINPTTGLLFNSAY